VSLEKWLKGAETTRFHTAPTIKENTVGQHSFNMLLIAEYIYDQATPVELLRAIIYHDLHEATTGDMPWPIKRHPAIREGIKQIEKEVNIEINATYEVTGYYEKMLAFIDIIEAMFFLLQERRLGNRNHNKIYNRALRVAGEYAKVLAVAKADTLLEKLKADWVSLS
jgi:5'-deoxynucleotidase YfbR-like HD superfamily hydrolase